MIINGISISPNGLIALEYLDLKNELEKNSYKSSRAILKYNNSPLLEMDSPVYTMNRRNLINILYKKFLIKHYFVCKIVKATE